MQITGARLQGNDLILSLVSPSDAGKFVYDFKAGEYELTKIKRKRSLDANGSSSTRLHKRSMSRL